MEETDPGALQAGLQHTLTDPMARILSTASKDSDFQGYNVATATGHEHNPASTVSVVHSSVVPTRGSNDRKRAAESAQRNRLGDSRRDGRTPPARRQTDASAPMGHVSQHGPGGGPSSTHGRGCPLGPRRTERVWRGYGDPCQ